MKKKLQILSVFITLAFFSCGSEGENHIDSNPVLNADFPVSGKLNFKPFNKYDVPTGGHYIIDDSTLWYFLRINNHPDYGYCYDLKTGAKLSVILYNKEAYISNEGVRMYLDASNFTPKIMGDSIQVYPDRYTIYTFAKKDIIENKPMNERKFSVVAAPDSIDSGQLIKLSNGSVVTTIGGILYCRSKPHKMCSLNDKSVVVFNADSANFYETINYNSFDVKSKKPEIDPKEIIKTSYDWGEREIKDNNLAVFSLNGQFILYTLDLNNGTVLKEKRYTDMKHSHAYMSSNSLMSLNHLKANDKYIFCVVNGYFSKKDKESKRPTCKLFVFDWDLNPIKRFDIPYERDQEYIVSNDGKSIYISKYNNKVLTLSKADIDI